MTVLVDMMGMAVQESSIATNAQTQQAVQANQCSNNTTTQDNDSLTNSIQLQTTMFTQAIHQLDALAECQATFKITHNWL